MYSTCIGLILKGYNDHEPQYQQYLEQVKLAETTATFLNTAITVEEPSNPEDLKVVVKEPRKPRVNFWDKFKIKMIDMFSEEDQMLNQ